MVCWCTGVQPPGGIFSCGNAFIFWRTAHLITIMWLKICQLPQLSRGKRQRWNCHSYFIELGSSVVLEQTQTLAVQPPVMSLALGNSKKNNVSRRNSQSELFLLLFFFFVVNLVSATTVESISGSRVSPGCPCWCNVPSSPPSPQWSSAS